MLMMERAVQAAPVDGQMEGCSVSGWEPGVAHTCQPSVPTVRRQTCTFPVCTAECILLSNPSLPLP